MMYGRGKSDSAIVAVKLVNKAGRLAAESVERRVGTKGKAAQEDPSDRVRPFRFEAARSTPGR